MRKLTAAMIVLPFLVSSGAALAGDAAAGKAKADSCMDCHAGEDFEGMSTAEIAAAIRAALSGQVKHPPALDEISEADVDDIAAYFAAEAGGQ